MRDKGRRMEKNVTVKRVLGKLSCVTGSRAWWSPSRKPTLEVGDQLLVSERTRRGKCMHLLCTETDEHCACSHCHVDVCRDEEQQSPRKREALPIVQFRVRKLHQARPEGM